MNRDYADSVFWIVLLSIQVIFSYQFIESHYIYEVIWGILVGVLIVYLADLFWKVVSKRLSQSTVDRVEEKVDAIMEKLEPYLKAVLLPLAYVYEFVIIVIIGIGAILMIPVVLWVLALVTVWSWVMYLIGRCDEPDSFIELVAVAAVVAIMLFDPPVAVVAAGVPQDRTVEARDGGDSGDGR